MATKRDLATTLLTGCEQANRACTCRRPDVCRVNGIARPLVTASLQCHDLDRQCQPSRAIAFAAIRAPHRRARCDDRFAIQTLRRRPPFGTADSSRFGAVSSCLDTVKIRLADVSVRGGPEGAPRGRFGEVDQQCRLEGRCGSADGSIWEAEPMEPN
jgi:hypothetical protein